jgi:membrane-bound acyltransferase YfiQ involved in biofilm formation
MNQFYIIVVLLLFGSLLLNSQISDEIDEHDSIIYFQQDSTDTDVVDSVPDPIVVNNKIVFRTYEDDFLKITIKKIGAVNKILVHDGFLAKGTHELTIDSRLMKPGFYIIEIHSSRYIVRKRLQLL